MQPLADADAEVAGGVGELGLRLEHRLDQAPADRGRDGDSTHLKDQAKRSKEQLLLAPAAGQESTG